MKPNKPDYIHVSARITLHGKGGWYAPARSLVDACKLLDRSDYLTLDGIHCYPAATLAAMLATYDKDARIDVYPIKATYKVVDYNNRVGRSYTTPDPANYIVTYSETYNALALCEHGTHSTQYLYPTRRDELQPTKRGGDLPHVADLTTEETTEPAPADPWIVKAISKDKTRKDKTRLDLTTSGGNLAADGFRLHYDSALPELEYTRRAGIMSQILPDARKNKHTITLGPAAIKALTLAVKRAGKINKDTVRLVVNGKLEVKAISEEYGDVSSDITAEYTYTGPEMLIGIDPKYLLDALSMAKNGLTIRLANPARPLYFTAGTREAVIMPKCLG
jgi:hypothetical protein